MEERSVDVEEAAPFVYKPYPSADELDLVPAEWAQRYVEDAAKHWDTFYARNAQNAYKARQPSLASGAPMRSRRAHPRARVGRTHALASGAPTRPRRAHPRRRIGRSRFAHAMRQDRHYLGQEFDELAASTTRRTILELGCGVGNTVFPMLAANPNLSAYAVDFSPRAIEMVRAHACFDPARIRAAVCDITCGGLPVELGEVRADVATLVFVLGSISPRKMSAAIRTAASGLRPSGRLFFRDHAVEDFAQQRFDGSSEPKRLEANLYVRRDKTLSYYFSLERARELFVAEGFVVERLEFRHARVENRRRALQMDRRFVTCLLYTSPSPRD